MGQRASASGVIEARHPCLRRRHILAWGGPDPAACEALWIRLPHAPPSPPTPVRPLLKPHGAGLREVLLAMPSEARAEVMIEALGRSSNQSIHPANAYAHLAPESLTALLDCHDRTQVGEGLAKALMRPEPMVKGLVAFGESAALPIARTLLKRKSALSDRGEQAR